MPQCVRGLISFGSAIAIAACSSRSGSMVPSLGSEIAANMRTHGSSFTVLHTFTDNTDGDNPNGMLLLYGGNLYGTTYQGGSGNDAGTIFEITSGDKENVLHRFGRKAPPGYRANPEAGLIRDAAGNFYGTTYSGGKLRGGTVFKVDGAAKVTTLHSFTGPDGAGPYAGVIRDAAGNLYGTTEFGGAFGSGTAFKLDAAGHESVLYSFAAGTDGGLPTGGLVRDSGGNLYGTTSVGGDLACAGGQGCGNVFMLDKAGIETVVHQFTGPPDGELPYAGLIRDAAGNLYGTTTAGGMVLSGGTVFKLDSAGNETVLYNFTGGADGEGPSAALIQDTSGNLYGTTYLGGGGSCGYYHCGTVFKLDTTGHETVLYRFAGGGDGAHPNAGLVMDAAGHLYGTATQRGDLDCHSHLGCGVVFKLKT